LCTIDLELFYVGVRLEGKRGKVVGEERRGEEGRRGPWGNITFWDRLLRWGITIEPNRPILEHEEVDGRFGRLFTVTVVRIPAIVVVAAMASPRRSYQNWTGVFTYCELLDRMEEAAGMRNTWKES
jgi:hypothetical protein